MSRQGFIVVAATLIFVRIASGQLSAATRPADIATETLRILNLDDPVQREAALSQVSADFHRLQDRLILAFEQARSKQMRAEVAYLIGVYRVDRAAAKLAPYVALDTGFKLDSSEPLISQFPVAEALVRIGSPAVPSLIHNLAISDDADVRQHSGSAIRVILGHATARFVLLQAIDSAAGDKASAERLKAALPLVEEPPKQ